MIFFENKLLQQPDAVFDSESNGGNLSSLALPDGEKKYNFHFFLQNDVTSRRGRFYQIFLADFVKKLENNFFSPRGGARELKLQPFDSESKTSSGCSDSLFSKTICFHSTIVQFIYH